jgi:O-antigen/teichoic acid export membrane protein
LSGKDGYARSVLISFVAVAGMTLLALGNSIVLARAAGPEGRGLYGLAVAISALALPIASAGLGPATTWQLSREQPYAQLLGLTRRAVVISVAFGAAMAGIAAAGSSLGLDEAAMSALFAVGLVLPKLKKHILILLIFYYRY